MTNATIPTGYKQTEVGIIPEDWDVLALKSITDSESSISYGIVQTGKSVTNGVKCIRVVDLVDGQIASQNLITTSMAISNSYSRTVLKEGDLVCALRGKIGELAVISKELAGANLTRGVAIIPLKNQVGDFYKQYLSSGTSKIRLENSLNGSALRELTIDTLRSFQVIVPEKEEQTAIATVLSDVDALIASLNAQIAKKRDIKTATMQQLLTGKQRLAGFGEGKGMKPSELGEIPEDWEVVQTKKIADVKSGKRLPLGESLIDKQNKHPYIRITDMKMGGVVVDDIKYVPMSVAPLISNYKIYVDDIFISVAGTLGLVGKIPEVLNGANLTENADKITNIKINQNFLMHVFQSKIIQDVIDSEKTLGAQPKLALIRIREFLIPLPETTEEQAAIAGVLSAMDEEIAALEQRLAKTKAMKQGMMQELLTGRTRLVVGSTKPSPFDLYEQTKRENFVHSSRLEGIDIPSKQTPASLADVLKKYSVD